MVDCKITGSYKFNFCQTTPKKNLEVLFLKVTFSSTLLLSPYSLSITYFYGIWFIDMVENMVLMVCKISKNRDATKQHPFYGLKKKSGGKGQQFEDAVKYLIYFELSVQWWCPFGEV